MVKRLVADTPMGREGYTEEFAHFTFSCIEISYINGVNLRIDGAAKLSHLWFKNINLFNVFYESFSS